MLRRCLLLVVMGSLGCSTTPSRAERLREQVRVRRGTTWSERWLEAQQRTAQWQARFELCEQARAGADIAPRTLAEVDGACAADVRTLEGVKEAQPGDLDAAARWARGPMLDPKLGGEFTCRAAALVPSDAERQLACAEVHLAAQSWAEARPFLMQAFSVGTSEQQCSVVRAIDRYSPSSRQDSAALPADVLRRCRASAPPTVATPLAPSPPASSPPAPLGGGQEVKSEPPAPLASGLQLNAELGTGGVSLGLGYASGNLAISLVPGLALQSLGPASTSNVSLGLAARFYFGARAPGALAGVLRPEFALSSSAATSGTGGLSTVTVTLGAAGGAEYLVSKHLGLTADLALRLGFLLDAPSLSVHLAPSLGLMIHL